jgi:nucleoside 2-deoxyribosyltransferase
MCLSILFTRKSETLKKNSCKSSSMNSNSPPRDNDPRELSTSSSETAKKFPSQDKIIKDCDVFIGSVNDMSRMREFLLASASRLMAFAFNIERD